VVLLAGLEVGGVRIRGGTMWTLVKIRINGIVDGWARRFSWRSSAAQKKKMGRLRRCGVGERGNNNRDGL
jgi:hypothetical protein